jgi:hypothetical protein
MSAPKENPQYRLASLEDVIFIGRLVKEFYAKRESIYKIPYDHETMLITIDELVRRGVVVVGPTSCAGASIDLFPSNCNYVVASVKFWYFQRPREIGIFTALCDECIRRGATKIDASAHAPDNTIGRYYEKIGMHACETVYLGDLENCCKLERKAVMAKTVMTDQTAA